MPQDDAPKKNQGRTTELGSTAKLKAQQRIQQALNSVIFRPDKGLVLDRLPAQDVCTTVRYWPVRNPDRTATIDWCFRVDG